MPHNFGDTGISLQTQRFLKENKSVNFKALKSNKIRRISKKNSLKRAIKVLHTHAHTNTHTLYLSFYQYNTNTYTHKSDINQTKKMTNKLLFYLYNIMLLCVQYGDIFFLKIRRVLSFAFVRQGRYKKNNTLFSLCR